MRTAFVLLLASAVTLIAAPVPKAKRATADGVWQLAEFDGHNGKIGNDMIGWYWRVADDTITIGAKTADELTPEFPKSKLRVRDEKQPHLRDYLAGNKVQYSAVLELDGDTLRWAWCTDPKNTITECKPADDVYYYVFKRVKGEK